MNNEEPHVNDLWEDMALLNSLYEELMWHPEDALDISPDFANNRIIITNKTMKDGRDSNI